MAGLFRGLAPRSLYHLNQHQLQERQAAVDLGQTAHHAGEDGLSRVRLRGIVVSNLKSRQQFVAAEQQAGSNFGQAFWPDQLALLAANRPTLFCAAAPPQGTAAALAEYVSLPPLAPRVARLPFGCCDSGSNGTALSSLDSYQRKNQCSCCSCDGQCGPFDGCPCNDCFALMEAEGLPRANPAPTPRRVVQASRVQSNSGENRNDSTQARLECKVCMAADVSTLLLPC